MSSKNPHRPFTPDPDDIPFGEVQKWFYRREPHDPELMKERARLGC